MENSLIIIIIQVVLIFSLIAIITFFIRLNETIKIEKRISKYSIKGSKNKFDKSYYDMVSGKYMLFVKKINRLKINALIFISVRCYRK